MSIVSAISTRCSLPRLFVALVGLFAVALIAVVATEPRTASAQPPATIEETELILRWRESVGVGSWNSFHWGGGTVRQLLDRLIQNGCTIDVDTPRGRLWEWTGSEWGKTYALLNDRASARGVSSRDIGVPPGTDISGMLDTVPRGTYSVRCVAGCGIFRSGEDDVSRLEDCPSQFDRARQTQAGQVRRAWGEEVEGKLVPRVFVAPPGADSRSANGLCWPLNHQRLAEWRLHLVIPYFATHPGTCLLRESGTENESGSAGGAARRSNDAPPVLALYEWSEGPRPADSELDDIPLVITVHEYCHANQYWHMQRSSRYESQLDVWEKFPRIRAAAHSNAMWWAVATPAGRAFVEAVGMRWNDTGGWAVSSFPFNVMYRRNPLELAAEICTEYYSKILEIDSRYAWTTWDLSVDDGQTNPWINRPERYDWNPGAVLTDEVVQWLNDYVLLPHVHPGSGRRPTNLGQCKEDMRVGLGQSCWVPNAPAGFVVPDGANGSAWSPCDQRIPGDLNDARIKVDVEDERTCGSLPEGWTFQAERVGDAWFVRAVGQWKNVGECASGQVVSPGEYCTVSLWRTGPGDLTPVQFRVYAVDELVPSDRLPGSERALHSAGGYAILYYWPDGKQPHADNGRLHHGKVRHPANGVALFEATKLRYRGEWRIDFAPSSR